MPKGPKVPDTPGFAAPDQAISSRPLRSRTTSGAMMLLAPMLPLLLSTVMLT